MIGMELLVFFLFFVIIDDVCKKLYCCKRYCFFLLSFLVVWESGMGKDNFFRIFFLYNDLLILNRSEGG